MEGNERFPASIKRVRAREFNEKSGRCASTKFNVMYRQVLYNTVGSLEGDIANSILRVLANENMLQVRARAPARPQVRSLRCHSATHGNDEAAVRGE